MESSLSRKLDVFIKSFDFVSTVGFSEASIDSMYRSAVVTEFNRTFEMGWKALQAAFDTQPGETVSGSPRSVILVAAHLKWITDERTWLDMLRTRNESIHRYDADSAASISEIETRYLPALHDLLSRLTAVASYLHEGQMSPLWSTEASMRAGIQISPHICHKVSHISLRAHVYCNARTAAVAVE